MSSDESYYTGRNKWPRWLKLLGFIAAVLFGVGVVDLARYAIMPPRATTPGSVTVVTSPVPTPVRSVVTQTKYVVPPGCQVAIEQLLAIMPSVTAIFNVAQPQLDVMSQARIEIQTKDDKGLNKLSFKQDELIDKTTDARRDLLERYNELKLKANECKLG